MIRHNPTWLCPQRTRLYINYLAQAYGKNALESHFCNTGYVMRWAGLLSSIEVVQWRFEAPGSSTDGSSIEHVSIEYSNTASQTGCLHAALFRCFALWESGRQRVGSRSQSVAAVV